MGVSHSRGRRNRELNEDGTSGDVGLVRQNASKQEESVEDRFCCGITLDRSKRKKIVWENNFLENCRSIAEEFEWGRDMIEMFTNCELDEAKYYQEMNLLRKEQQVKAPNHTEILKNQAEVDRFRFNLRKSVLVSSFSKASSSASSQIAGVIDTRSSRSRIDIERNPYLNRKKPIAYPKAMSVASKSSYRNSVISLIDGTISSMMGAEREITCQSTKDLQIFLKFSMVLERHLGDVGCMLGRIKRLFVVYVEKTYRDVNAASSIIGDFTDDVKQFLVVLKEAIIDYYDLGSFSSGKEENNFINNEENILSACTAILFKDPTFYAQTFAIVTQYYHEREANFAKILELLKDSTPDKFMVKDKFCLNFKTIKVFSRLQQASSADTNNAVEGFDEKGLILDNNEPYKQCIEQMRELAKTKSPISKMKAIVACSEAMASEIEQFYDQNGLKKQKQSLDADQVLSIFCYILVQAKVQNLLSHLFILENFATNHQLISISGYYLSVINCAIEQLENDFKSQTHPQSS